MHIKPAACDAANRKFYTKRGFLTRYALACGYVDRRGNGARLEQVSSNGSLRVYGPGGPCAYIGYSLAAARRAFMAFRP